MWIGATSIGTTANLDISSGETIGAAVALMTGSDLEVAVAFALPVAVIMQMLNIMKMTAFYTLMHSADIGIDDGNEKKVSTFKITIGVIVVTFVLGVFGIIA